jgi:hypothetical protein
VGKRRPTLPDPTSLHLSADEADAIAADLARVWRGATGLAEVPSPDMLADLVQRVARKARETIAARPDLEF